MFINCFEENTVITVFTGIGELIGFQNAKFRVLGAIPEKNYKSLLTSHFNRYGYTREYSENYGQVNFNEFPDFNILVGNLYQKYYQNELLYEFLDHKRPKIYY